MKVTWIGHSCFKIESNQASVVIDPYADGSVPGYAPVRETANMVLCSHEHGDHNARDCVSVAPSGSNVFTVDVLDTYHDEAKGTKRGPNKIHIISDGTMNAAHMGDLGCEPTTEQKELLKGLDLMMIPVGGFYTIDAKEAANIVKELQPKHVIPMHYSGKTTGYDVIGPVERFTELMDSVAVLETSETDLSSEITAQVIVLKAKNC